MFAPTRRTLIAAAPALALARRAHAQPPVVRVALDGRPNASHAAFFLAEDQGFFAEQGVLVRFDAAQDATEAMNRLLDKSADLALGYLMTLIRYLDENRQSGLRATLNLMDRSPHALAARPSKDISASMRSLAGRKLGGGLQDPATAQWPLLARMNGIDPAQTALEPLGPNVREPALISGEVDGIFGASYALPASLLARGLPQNDLIMLDFADYGLDLYSSALVAGPELLADESLLLRFERALMAAYRLMVRFPMQAVTALRRRDDKIAEAVAASQIERLLTRHILTASVRANGFGGFDFSRLQTLLLVMAAQKPFKAPLPYSDILNLFHLPSEAERRILEP